MKNRYLTTTMQPDWSTALRIAGRSAKANTYQDEVLNFESPAHFFGQLTEKRWALVRACQGRGELSVRELARTVGRDVKRVHASRLGRPTGPRGASGNGSATAPWPP